TWRLARHHLAEGADAGSLEEAARDTLGIQAQVMSCAEQSLIVRVPKTRPEDVRGALWEDRTLVRTWAMRGTLHLFAAWEYPGFVAALSTREHWRTAPWLRMVGMSEVDVERLIEAVDKALAGRCLSRGGM